MKKQLFLNIFPVFSNPAKVFPVKMQNFLVKVQNDEKPIVQEYFCWHFSAVLLD